MSWKGLLYIIIVVVLLFVGFNFFVSDTTSTQESTGQEFLQDNLATNTSKRSVGLNEILDGGPGKDGIPALTDPEFVSVSEAEAFLDDEIRGIVVEVGGETRFYPYNILVWHEIVNDVVGGKPLVITFCPLCGSAIVFDTSDRFGVSGKLYESNLLMYDRDTESLWSQALGRAVVGDRLGEELDIYPAQVLTFGEVKSKWPSIQVLSRDTGHIRNYNVYPYGDYDNNESLIFPVSVSDTRFPAKEIMYVVRVGSNSVAFPIKDISEDESSLEEVSLTVQKVDGEIVVEDSSGETLPGYYEMWFSWATHHQEDGIVWQK